MYGLTKRFTAFFVLLFSGVFLYAEESAPIAEHMSELVIQLGLILFAVKIAGRLAKKVGIPSVLGELLVGVLIGPYALGAFPIPGFPHGLFPLNSPSLAVSPELYAFATVASIILLFASGLETDIGLFLRYSFAGGVIGIGGVVVSFLLGDFLGMYILNAPFVDPRCMFLGILSTATSVGITARILSDQKKMDTPEGVSILAAAVFDDVLGIIMLAVVLGLVAVMSGDSAGLSSGLILGIAGKAFGIWLLFTVLGLVFANKIAAVLKRFRHSYDFAILALGLALFLAGIFEKQGLAMIIGAYICGLSLSKTDIAAVIQERIHGLYEFFVPVFFAVMGMMVNVREIMNPEVLLIGLVFSLIAILSKIIGCGLPALGLGFNIKGALRIGSGMVPRGEVALIIAGIGLTSGILNERLFGIVIIMTLLTTLLAPPLLSFSLKLPGLGTRKAAKGDDSVLAEWEFPNHEIADLVVDTLLKDLRAEGFYVQIMNMDEGLSQARKDSIALSIEEDENKLTIATSKADLPLVKTAVYEVILELHNAIEALKTSSDPAALRKELADMDGRTDKDVLSLINPDTVCINLKGNTKREIIEEMVEMLDKQGKLLDKSQVLEDVLKREETMSTGMQHGIALPHGKSDGVADICAAVGIKKTGVDFESIDGELSRLFIMIVSPKKISGPHIQFLAAISAILKDESVREMVINADSKDDVVSFLRTPRKSEV